MHMTLYTVWMQLRTTLFELRAHDALGIFVKGKIEIYSILLPVATDVNFDYFPFHSKEKDDTDKDIEFIR